MPRSPFVLIHPEGHPMAFPVGSTFEEVKAAAVWYAREAEADVEMVRDEGHGRTALGTAHPDGTFEEASS